MELDNIQSVWQQYNQEIQVNVKLNAEAALKQKVQDGLKKVLAYRIIEGAIFIVIISGLVDSIKAEPAFTAPIVSAGLLCTFAIIGLIGSIGQVVMISKLDYSRGITRVQKQLENIKAHALGVFKLILCTIPFWMAYFFFGFKLITGFDIFPEVNSTWLMSNLIFSGVLMVAVAYVVSQLSFKNMHKKWVNKLVTHAVGREVAEAASFIEEIDNFKRD
ncbi:hypothetical protein [Fulvivirga ligni]|uniref:hypothetical protein n=1 Tax=Fulvivirga ligni TaxID=2904246 RepID=UPI001F203CED|nr:hypothetical protein [Fulvivirga ligni]UII22720.1 hypothetical protein LVD16_05710 [Fulvivirga ligni]